MYDIGSQALQQPRTSKFDSLDTFLHMNKILDLQNNGFSFLAEIHNSLISLFKLNKQQHYQVYAG